VCDDSLLHRHGAGQRRRRAGECHHQPVAEVLDLVAYVTSHGLAQHCEMRLPHRFGVGRVKAR
jgi:hypothetical protein